MPMFRKKPVVIEAQRVPALTDNDTLYFHKFANLAVWCKGTPQGQCINIQTLEGTMTANPGDWIIKGVNGEFYPCKPDIFEKIYEPVL